MREDSSEEVFTVVRPVKMPRWMVMDTAEETAEDSAEDSVEEAEAVPEEVSEEAVVALEEVSEKLTLSRRPQEIRVFAHCIIKSLNMYHWCNS